MSARKMQSSAVGAQRARRNGTDEAQAFVGKLKYLQTPKVADRQQQFIGPLSTQKDSLNTLPPTKMTGSDHSRDPCPYSIVNDFGIGFCMGAMGGSVWHGFKGYRNSPRGERLAGSLASIKARAPVLGGNFAVWSGLFNAGDCLLAGIRGKEDIWNPIMAGASTGAILAARSGPRVMAISAVFGGAILAVMEGVGVLISRSQSAEYNPQAPALPEDFQPQTAQQQLAVLSNQQQQHQQHQHGQAATTATQGTGFVTDEGTSFQQPQAPQAPPQRRGLFGLA
ncbi:Tim17/Tim22/Tim23/Pmp24 family-domain-containing protein [Phlyctochytrium arcticum]|nr:Tim17/Tim22/Tim23/Pmp24 family-domain-containing protein [Phlyctochytrium arcticum]